MSPGRNDSPGGTVPIGFSFAFADLAILMSPERSAHPGVALGTSVAVSEPVDKSKSKHHDNENFKKRTHVGAILGLNLQSKQWPLEP
jgi:hypothetical protein